jgi:hypothetical protein
MNIVIQADGWGRLERRSLAVLYAAGSPAGSLMSRGMVANSCLQASPYAAGATYGRSSALIQSPTLRAALRIQRANLLELRESHRSISTRSSADVAQRTRPTSCMA